MSFLLILCFAFLLFIACLLIARFGRNWNLKPAVALSSGLLLSLCFLDFLPHALEDKGLLPPLFVLIGILAQALADIYLLPKLTFLDRWLKTDGLAHSKVHSHSFSASSVCSMAGCLSICSFFDGWRLWAALELEGLAAVLAAFSLFFHLLSEGALLAFLALSTGIRTKILLFLALCLPASLLLGGGLAEGLAEGGFPHLVAAFASGILIYMCFVHLLPSCLKGRRDRPWFFAGLLAFTLLKISTEVLGF